MERHEIAWIVAGVFATAAVVFSFVQIRDHLLHTREMYRKYVVRILLMVPLYAVEAWLGLRFKGATMYFDVLRECYEAFVIFSFYSFLVVYLGGEEHLLTSVLAHKPQQKHMFPFCWKRPWVMGGPNDSFLLNTKIGVLQYVVVKPLLGLIAFICDASGVYGDGEIVADRAYVYIAFLANASQVWAMYCLVLFYVATKQELAPCRPIPKFLTVKATVFFTWWQGVLLAVLARVGVLGETETYTTENIVMGLQDFILCIEMLLAAFAHHYAFNYKDFSEAHGTLNPDDTVSPSLSSTGSVGARPLVRSIFEAVNVSDIFLKDVRHVHAQVQKKRKRNKDQQLLQAADYSDERKLNAAGMLGAGKISIDMTALRRDVSVSESSLAGGVDDGDDGGDDTSPLTTPQSAAAAAAVVAAAAGGGGSAAHLTLRTTGGAGDPSGAVAIDSPPYSNALPGSPSRAASAASTALGGSLVATLAGEEAAAATAVAAAAAPAALVAVGTPPDHTAGGEGDKLLRARNASDA